MQIYSLEVGGREGATVKNDRYSQGPVTKLFVSFHLLYQILWLHHGLYLISVHHALVRYSHILMRENLKKIVRKDKLSQYTSFLSKSLLLTLSESESKLFSGDTSNDNHSPGPVIREVSPQPLQEK